MGIYSAFVWFLNVVAVLGACIWLYYNKIVPSRLNALVFMLEKFGFCCVVMQSKSAKIVYLSPKLAQYIDTPVTTMAGLEALLQSEKTETPLQMLLQQAQQCGQSDTMPITLQWHKTVCFDVSAAPLSHNQNILFMWRDMSGSVQKELELRQALDIAQNANHAKGNFLANMSHELKTPLNIIIGFSEIMKKEMFGALNNTKYTEYVQAIHRSGTHLLDLISDILDMSRIEAGRYELSCAPYDPLHVAHEAIALIDPLAQYKNMALRLASDETAGAIDAYGDGRALKQILLNLLNNAVKYCPNGAHIELHYWLDATHKTQNFVVADNGTGIPTEVVHAIGTPFISTKRTADVADTMREGSTGLGLSIVKSLIELHNGTLNIHANASGTKVHVCLPLLFEPSEMPTRAVA